MLPKSLQKFLLATSCLFLVQSSALAGPLTFESAVNEYRAGKYQSALGMFKAFNAASPKNTMVHYYLALCHQRLGHIEQAKQEYQYVISSGDARYSAVAQQGLSRVSGIRASGGAASAPSASKTTSGSPSQTTSANKAKKVIEFYADW